MGITYSTKSACAKSEVEGYSDASWGNDVTNGRSRHGYVFIQAGGAVSWVSKIQEIVTLSTTEAEYVAAVEAGKEAIWYHEFMNEIGVPHSEVKLYLDNKSTISLVQNPVFQKRTKHIRLRYHKIREWVANNELKIEFVPSTKMAADFLTKPVPFKTPNSNLKLIGMNSD